MRIYYAFLVMVVAAVLWMLPITMAIYDFRTDLRTDEFTSPTGLDENSVNVTLHKPIYDDDTGTSGILSDLPTDVPLYSSYNTTSRQFEVSGLTANTTRLLTVSYNIDALLGSNAINTLVDILPFIWMLCVVAFPMAALFAIFTGRL